MKPETRSRAVALVGAYDGERVGNRVRRVDERSRQTPRRNLSRQRQREAAQAVRWHATARHLFNGSIRRWHVVLDAVSAGDDKPAFLGARLRRSDVWATAASAGTSFWRIVRTSLG